MAHQLIEWAVHAPDTVRTLAYLAPRSTQIAVRIASLNPSLSAPDPAYFVEVTLGRGNPPWYDGEPPIRLGDPSLTNRPSTYEADRNFDAVRIVVAPALNAVGSIEMASAEDVGAIPVTPTPRR